MNLDKKHCKNELKQIFPKIFCVLLCYMAWFAGSFKIRPELRKLKQ